MTGIGRVPAVGAATTVPAPLRRRLRESIVSAALMRHVDGASPDKVLAYLRDRGRYPEARARQRHALLDDPRWRTHVFVHDEGYGLVRRWVELASPAERPARFGRLLREPLTPSQLAADLAGKTPATGESAETGTTA